MDLKRGDRTTTAEQTAGLLRSRKWRFNRFLQSVIKMFSVRYKTLTSVSYYMKSTTESQHKYELQENLPLTALRQLSRA